MNVEKANRIAHRKFAKICEDFFIHQTITEDEFIQKAEQINKKLNRQKYEAAGIRA